MRKPILTALAAAIGLMATCLITDKAEAVPAFARQYKTECKTCHTIFPERNEFGDAFEKNSFVWPGKVPGQKDAKAPTEADGGKSEAAATGGNTAVEKQVEALWNSGIPVVVPVSFLAEHAMTYDRKQTPRLDLDAETSFEVFTAGSLQNKVGFFAEYSFSDSEVGEVFGQVRKPFDLPVNVKAGKFKPKLSLWKSNDRVTVSKARYVKMSADDDEFEIFEERGAVELNSVIGKRLFAAAGVTDSSKGDRATNSKNYYGHVSVRFSGTDFLGNEPEVDLDKDSVWDYLTVTLGGFGIGGATVNTADTKNSFYRAGLESELIYKNLKVKLGGIVGKDDNFDGTNLSRKSLYLMSEARYFILPELLAAVRYEYDDLEHDEIVRSVIPSISYAVLQSLKLSLEYENKNTSSADENITTLLAAFSF